MLCEGAGLPICVEVTPGQTHEATVLERLLDRVRITGTPGRPRVRFDTVAGDKGYDGSAQRAAIRQRRAKPLIPTRKLHDGSYPERAGSFDKVQYKRRNIIERLTGRLKEFRRIATRYDKLAKASVPLFSLASSEFGPRTYYWTEPSLIQFDRVHPTF